MSIYYDTFILHLIQDIDYLFVRKQNNFKPLNIGDKSKRLIM